MITMHKWWHAIPWGTIVPLGATLWGAMLRTPEIQYVKESTLLKIFVNVLVVNAAKDLEAEQTFTIKWYSAFWTLIKHSTIMCSFWIQVCTSNKMADFDMYLVPQDTACVIKLAIAQLYLYLIIKLLTCQRKLSSMGVMFIMWCHLSC